MASPERQQLISAAVVDAVDSFCVAQSHKPAQNRATFESQTYAIGAFAPACARAYGNATPLTPLLQSNFGIH